MGSAASACLGKKRKLYSEHSEINRIIDSELLVEAKKKAKVLKILLLGPSDSGKSTVVKQMRLLHTDGFSAEERTHYMYTIFSNLMDCCAHIARGVHKLGLEVPAGERPLMNKFAHFYDGQHFFNFLDEHDSLVGMMSQFFRLSCVKVACQRFPDFAVPDNSYYLVEERERFFLPDYEPSKEDIINARASTRGIYEINFAFRNFTIRLIDVGGQKTERRKWIHCFEDVHAILFVVSLSCYNQVLEEDQKSNQMEDTLAVFSQIFWNRFLRRSFFVMFFNKKDLLRKKLQSIPLEKFYPKFGDKLRPKMGENEVCKEAIAFVKQMFMQIKGDDRRQIYSHLTNATNSQNIDFVFRATCDILISKNMELAGMN